MAALHGPHVAPCLLTKSYLALGLYMTKGHAGGMVPSVTLRAALSPTQAEVWTEVTVPPRPVAV